MVLFIDACVRARSRTHALAEYLLEKLDGPVEKLRLEQVKFPVADEQYLNLRDTMGAKRDYAHPVFALARQFVSADTVVIAAPCWDLSFPASLKQYFEQVNIPGLSFFYTQEGWPKGLCRAKRLYYVTTAGGQIPPEDYGFGYVRAMAEGFYQIPAVHCVRAEGLDLPGADIPAILARARAEIDGLFPDAALEKPGAT